MTRIHIFIMAFIFFVLPGTTAAALFGYDSLHTVRGAVGLYGITGNESLIELARKFDLGYNEIMDANPGLDPFIPGDGSEVILPTFWVLPDTESDEAIVVNLSELRLYYFYRQRRERLVETFPIGIGSEGHNTPIGVFRVVEKIMNPSWYVPESIREENPELPKVVPPGPNNPLGSHALRLSDRTILMHGTNRPFAVGRLASHGCMRLYPEDIPKLFGAVPIGAKVIIVRQPVKVGLSEGRVYIEVHNDREADLNLFDTAVALLRKKGLLARADIVKMYEALKRKDGVPTDITEQMKRGPFISEGPLRKKL